MIKNKHGFSLLELLVVVTIIAILATIAIPRFSEYRVKANNAAALSDIRNFRTLMEVVYSDSASYPVF